MEKAMKRRQQRPQDASALAVVAGHKRQKVNAETWERKQLDTCWTLLEWAGVPEASLMVVGLLDAPQEGIGQQPKGQRYRGRWEDGGS